MISLLFSVSALALTTPDPGAVPLPAGVDLTLPFPEGVEVVVSCGYGPGCSSFHVGTDRAGSTNDYYALDLIRNEAGNGEGESIVAAWEGEVVYADWATDGWASFGRIVLLEHDFGDGHTYMTLYAHLQSLSVSVGDVVSAKQEIGLMGDSGNFVDGWFSPHVHFSLYRNASFLGGPYGGNAVVPELIDGYGDLWHGDLLTSGPGPGGIATILTVDDLDAGFTLTGPASEHFSGGYGPSDHFFYQPAEAAGAETTSGTWIPEVPETAIYKVQAFIPYSDHATATQAPFTIRAHGETVATTQDQSIIGGDFHDLLGGRGFKLVAGSHGRVELHNGSGDPSANDVAFDAIRFVRIGEVGSLAEGDACVETTECSGDLLCGDGTCRASCFTTDCGVGGTCDEATGLCDIWPGDEATGGTEPEGGTEPGSGTSPGEGGETGDTDDTSGRGPGVDGSEGSRAPGSSSCSTAGAGPWWLGILTLVGLGRRRR